MLFAQVTLQCSLYDPHCYTCWSLCLCARSLVIYCTPARRPVLRRMPHALCSHLPALVRFLVDSLRVVWRCDAVVLSALVRVLSNSLCDGASRTSCHFCLYSRMCFAAVCCAYTATASLGCLFRYQGLAAAACTFCRLMLCTASCTRAVIVLEGWCADFCEAHSRVCWPWLTWLLTMQIARGFPPGSKAMAMTCDCCMLSGPAACWVLVLAAGTSFEMFSACLASAVRALHSLRMRIRHWGIGFFGCQVWGFADVAPPAALRYWLALDGQIHICTCMEKLLGICK